MKMKMKMNEDLHSSICNIRLEKQHDEDRVHKCVTKEHIYILKLFELLLFTHCMNEVNHCEDDDAV